MMKSVVIWIKGYFFDDTIAIVKFLYRNPVLGCLTWLALAFMGLITVWFSEISPIRELETPGTPETSFHLSTASALDYVGYPKSVQDHALLDLLQTDSTRFHLRWVSTAIPDVRDSPRIIYATGAVTDLAEEIRFFPGMSLVEGSLPADEKPGVLVTRKLANKTRWKVGDTVSFVFRNPHEDKPLWISASLSGILDVNDDWGDSLERIYMPWNILGPGNSVKPYNEIALVNLRADQIAKAQEWAKKYSLNFITPYRHQRLERAVWWGFYSLMLLALIMLRGFVMGRVRRAVGG